MGSFFQQDVSSYSTGSTAQGIKASKLGYLKVVLPPIDEQHAIVGFLDADRCRGARLEGRIAAAVDALAEFRSSLIAAAVTGQIDVREAA
jgi:type I restriction enzyme S subunit